MPDIPSSAAAKTMVEHDVDMTTLTFEFKFKSLSGRLLASIVLTRVGRIGYDITIEGGGDVLLVVKVEDFDRDICRL